MDGGMKKIAIFDKYLPLSRKWYKIGSRLLWNANRNSYAIHFQWLWVTSLPRFQDHDIIQRQLTQKWYNTWLYLQWQTESKAHKVYRTAPFSITFTTPDPDFKVTPLFCLRNGTIYIVTAKYWKGLTHALLTGVVSNDLEWPRVSRRNIQWHAASRGFSATDSRASC